MSNVDSWHQVGAGGSDYVAVFETRPRSLSFWLVVSVASGGRTPRCCWRPLSAVVWIVFGGEA